MSLMKMSNRYTEHIKKLLRRIYYALSCLQKVDLNRERIREAEYFAAISMETWINLGLSVTPKVHIFEDYAVESTHNLNCMGDKTVGFIELY